jgi:hypothetical protein
MAGLNLPIVEPTRFQVEVAVDYDGATTQQAGLNKLALLLRGLGFLAGLAGFMLIAAVVSPSPSDTDSPSGFSLTFIPGGMPAMRGTKTKATSSGQVPVMQMRSPVESIARVPAVPLRNTPPAMQMSSTAFDPLDLEPSEESQATIAYAVPSSHINHMQPGHNVVNSDSGVSGSTLGWLSILALSTAGAYMAGKTVQSRGQRVEMRAAAAMIATSSTSLQPQGHPSHAAAAAVTMSHVTQETVTRCEMPAKAPGFDTAAKVAGAALPLVTSLPAAAAEASDFDALAIPLTIASVGLVGTIVAGALPFLQEAGNQVEVRKERLGLNENRGGSQSDTEIYDDTDYTYANNRKAVENSRTRKKESKQFGKDGKRLAPWQIIDEKRVDKERAQRREIKKKTGKFFG